MRVVVQDPDGASMTAGQIKRNRKNVRNCRRTASLKEDKAFFVWYNVRQTKNNARR